MKIKLENGEVVNDRRNGNKLKLSTSDFIKVSCIVGGSILVGISGWYNLKADVTANAKEVIKIASNTNANIKQDKDIISMSGDITYIKKDVSNIIIEQKEQNKLLLEIRDRLPR